MGDITRISITATTPQTAQHLKTLIDAARISAGQIPVHHPHARRIIFRVPTASGGNVFLLKEQPIAGVEGLKLLPEEEEKGDSGTRMNNETLLGWYVYASVNPSLLEINQEY